MASHATTLPVPGSDDLSPDSSLISNARYTPESGSDDSDPESESDLDLGSDGELRESFRLQTRPSERRPRGSRVPHSDNEDEEEEEYELQYRMGRALRGSISTVQSFQLYTPDEERALVRKFDQRLVFFVAILYMLSFLDRSNIGNAKIAGMEEDLHLDSNQYEWVITGFYISYICFEWMSILWKLIPPHIYVTFIVLSWGVTASLQSITTNFGGLLLLRILLGIGEAGFTGIPYYLSFFFKRDELALRTGLFVSAAPLATSFASSLAWAIISLANYLPIAPWRLLFLVEGFPSVLFAVAAWRIIPDSPGTAPYLSKRERKIARLRLRRERDPAEASHRGPKWREVLETITDPKNCLTAAMFFFTNMAFSSMPVFLPTILHSMNHSVLVSQALCAPLYLAAFLAVITTAYLSDRLQSRGIFICIYALFSASGYAFIAFAGARGLGTWVRYLGLYPAAIGFFTVIALIITWTINNQESENKRGMGFAMLQLIGQCGPLVGTRLYPASDGPTYVRGMSICAAAMILVALLSILLRFYLQRKNQQAEQKYEQIGDEGNTLVSNQRQGSSKTPFKFML